MTQHVSRFKKLPHRRHFLTSFAKNALIAFALLIFSLLVGMVGYHNTMNLEWVDALLNASMILTGMGPVDRADNDSAKIFASCYAIYSGVAFLTSVAFLYVPLLHRFLHKFHIDVEEK